MILTLRPARRCGFPPLPFALGGASPTVPSLWATASVRLVERVSPDAMGLGPVWNAGVGPAVALTKDARVMGPTGAAIAGAVPRYTSVFRIVGVPLRTMSLGGPMRSRVTSPRIFSRRHGLQVGRIAASRHPAEMVKDKSVRDGAAV